MFSVQNVIDYVS